MLRRASGTVTLPRDLSTKNVKGSSRLPGVSFVSDRFFDLSRRDVIVLCQVVESVPRVEPFRNNVGGDSGANEDWSPERNQRINHYPFRFVVSRVFLEEGVQAHDSRVDVPVDATQVPGHDLFHLNPPVRGDVDQATQLADEEIH